MTQVRCPSGGPSYCWCAFYVVYLLFGLFVLGNLMLAIIWDVYKAEYRRKALKTRADEREGLLKAFMTLDFDSTGDFTREVWHPFIRAMLPHVNFHEADLMFDMLDVSGNGAIGPHEFIKLNDLIQMYFHSPLDVILAREDPGPLTTAMQQLVSSGYFEAVVSTTIFLMSIVLLANHKGMAQTHLEVSFYISATFLFVFLVELLLRALAFGTRALFADWSKAFDTLIILASVFGYIFVIATPALPNKLTCVKVQSLLIFRVVRLFMPGASAIANRYHMLVSTLVATIPPCCGLLITLGLILYCYAVIGMEAFCGVLSYADHPVENFNTFGHACLALFQCLMINNWNDLLTGCMASLSAPPYSHPAIWGVYAPAAYFLSFIGLEVEIGPEYAYRYIGPGNSGIDPEYAKINPASASRSSLLRTSSRPCSSQCSTSTKRGSP